MSTNASASPSLTGEGRFAILPLPPASLSHQVELQGFSRRSLANFVFAPGEPARPAITLGVALGP